MLTHPNKTLIKNNAFRVTFILGLTCTLISGILNVVATSSDTGYYCIDYDYCDDHYYYYSYTKTCLSYHSLYCCRNSGSGSDYYSCGSYYNSCKYVGSNYSICSGVDGLYVGMYICGSLALACLIAMVVIASRHKNQVHR